MKLFKFSKPKTPGFGIGSHYFLSVLSGQAMLPPIREIVDPKGADGAVVGFGVPLMPGTTKEDLFRPMGRGEYALASPDRKTVLRLRILSKEEAGFDPELVAASALAASLGAEELARIRSTWILMQLNFESHDADVFPALDFMLAVAGRLGGSTQGVIADPTAQRYLLPECLKRPDRADPRVDAREHVAFRFEASGEGMHAFTLGMQKFALAEYEIYRLEAGERDLAVALLTGICQNALTGNIASAGQTVGSENVPFEIREGGLDRAKWEGIPCLELLPPTGRSPGDVLRVWAASQPGP